MAGNAAILSEINAFMTMEEAKSLAGEMRNPSPRPLPEAGRGEGRGGTSKMTNAECLMNVEARITECRKLPEFVHRHTAFGIRSSFALRNSPF
jgi:hypothetical protein